MKTDTLVKKLLSRADIIDAQDMETVDVDVPEWGGVVRIKSLTGQERDAFEASLFVGEGAKRKQNLKNLRSRLVATTLVDESGNRLFSDDASVLELSKKSAAALNRVFEAAQKLNGMTGAEAEALGKDLEKDPSEDSTSA